MLTSKVSARFSGGFALTHSHSASPSSSCTRLGVRSEKKKSGKLWKTNHHNNLIYFLSWGCERREEERRKNSFKEDALLEGVIVNCVNSIKPFTFIYGTQEAKSWRNLLSRHFKNIPSRNSRCEEVKEKHLQQQHQCDIFMYIKASCGESRREGIWKMEPARYPKIPKQHIFHFEAT